VLPLSPAQTDLKPLHRDGTVPAWHGLSGATAGCRRHEISGENPVIYWTIHERKQVKWAGERDDEIPVAISFPFFKPTPDSLVRRLQDLPPTPKILHTLRRLVDAPDTTIEAIAGVLQMEPGLSARVVRIANSTQFCGSVRVDTIMEAIQRVGLVGVQELVTYAVVSQLVGRPLDTYQISAQNLWHRAIACALAAAGLADRGDVNRDDAYTAGLMHGIGLTVIDRHAAQNKTKRVLGSEGYPLDFSAAERDWLGFSHAEAGAALLNFWGFPETVSMAVRHQLNPEAAAAEHRKLSMILATARWARSLFCVPEETIPELPSTLWLEESGVQIEDFDGWLRTLRIRFNIACTELLLT
jgi:HD-like signal output (HDOD) protein